MKIALCFVFFMLSLISTSIEAAQTQTLQAQAPNSYSRSSTECYSDNAADSSRSHELTDKAEQAMRQQAAQEHKSASELGLEIGHSSKCVSRVILSISTGQERTTEKSALMLSLSGEYSTISYGSGAASITAFGAGALYRLYFRAQPSSFYVAVRASVFLCMEDFGDDTNDNSVVSFGPRISQALGWRLSNTFNVEFGVYEQALFSSSILANDVGFFGAISLTL